MNTFTRNIPLLSFCQAMLMSGNSLVVATAALVGLALAEDKSLATLPLATQFIATMFTSIPASLLMDRIGRKPGFMLATLFGFSGATLATVAIMQHQFWWFVAATSLFGIYNGFGIYYRFAAADAVDEAHKSRAISFVIAGGVIAAVIGPNLANFTRESIPAAEFAGSYAAMLGLYLLTLVSLGFISLPHRYTDHHHADAPRRPLKLIASQPAFIVALICGMLGYGVMSLVMTATPLAMHQHHHVFGDTSFVIQWHVLGMFAPSFFTGHLIRRFGLLKILFTGALLGVLCVVINLIGTSLSHFWFALVCLGISWNFLFIGATTLLTTTYEPAERARTQALNDFVVFTTVSISALTAGSLQNHYGWRMVNLGVIPLLLIIVASILWLAWKTRGSRDY